MDRNDAHKLIRQYAGTINTILDVVPQGTNGPERAPASVAVCHSDEREKLAHIIDMAERCGEHGERKMMRWLGYIQGVLVAFDIYTLEQVKEHSKARRVERPTWLQQELEHPVEKMGR